MKRALILALLLTGCSHIQPYPSGPFGLPPCSGTWVCDHAKGFCECVDQRSMGEWWRRNAP